MLLKVHVKQPLWQQPRRYAMKKMIAVLFAALLIVSAIPAFAQDVGVEVEAEADSGDADDSDDQSEQSNEGEGRTRTEVRAEFRERLEDGRERRERIRTEVREEVKEFRSEMRADAKAFLDLRVRVRTACKQDDASTGCTELRAEMHAEAKERLVSSADRMIALLEEAKDRIEASGLDATVKAELIARIDAHIQAIADAKADAEALSDTPTRAEIQEISRELREAWKDSRQDLRVGIGRTVNMRMAGILEKSEQLEKRFDRVIAKLQEKGIDTTSIEAQQDAYAALIAEARAAHLSSVQLFAQGDVTAAHEQLTIAKAKLKEAHQLLKELVADIRAANQGAIQANAEANAEANAGAEASA